ncbi:MAG TPA: DNA mismatch repair endonuclease MutH [Polyangiaceae bacterium LLY-WYZ-15_(1-7)]|nr:DNA mismatch repair endonuclease MutH [Polyangiaceae bacterium LLY-WYZ-15_(1-7)]HJL04109.1 DNA mismatch repair endonuclease MutH [Polyangiaceae bacterium LLY-WYZ-15_(1-7)]HJL09625.1 DNA mismatch repair endonuclease MutH [Polyangiaceae bacterium LLY-WYZ-15_(1-7)]HJL27329.1 DNA mismatch repair endonuclease MutH [Polyangiaceae bacterium LLY-WYZ-15_(1-7)]HJL33305.1 DNA mismatch repair endonuclease MutH [Polyangiaceae bacterium LLY-WYZ-15_(1-7)]
MEPPRSEEVLVERAHGLAGRTVGELGRSLEVDVPATPRRAKGLVGQLVERALGASAGSADEPDFLEIGVELKTLPVGPEGRPKESTFVATIKLNEMAETDWEASTVWRKLRRVLWVPVEADPALPLPARRLGAAILWSPSAEQVAALRADWETIATYVLRGEADRITGHLGTYLQVRPKAAHGGVRTRAPDAAGGYQWTGPRGFYLRTRFTEQVLRAL